MKKLTVIILAILIVSGISFSQTSTKTKRAKEKIFLGLSVGPGFPMSDFANKEKSDVSGYAKTGYKIQAFGGFNLIGAIGICIAGFTNQNGVDPEQLINYLNTSYPGNTWTSSTKTWQLYGGFGGLSFYYPVNKNVTLDFRVLTGFVSAKSPELLFLSGNNSYKIETSTASAFSYQTYIGLNYYVGQNVSISGAIDFMSSRPNFVDVKTTYNVNGNTSDLLASFNRQINIVNATIGFRYSIR